MRRVVCLLILAVVVGGGAWMLPSCSTNPATGRMQFNLISEDHEISLGMQAAPQFLQEYGGPVQQQQVIRHVRQMGQKLAASSERPHLPWEFHVPNSDVINAFALPGGKVFVTRGMLARMENDAQLAGVLGHEIGHVTAQHVNQRMSQALVVAGVATGLGAAGAATDRDYLTVLGAGAGAAGGVYLLKFGRDQESEADALGVRYMTQHGYNPWGQVQVMQILQREMGDGRGGPEFLSTHPYPETRIERLTKLIHEQYPQASQRGALTFDQESYVRNVLEPLKALPAPRKKGADKPAGRHERDRFMFAEPATWCGFCAMHLPDDVQAQRP